MLTANKIQLFSALRSEILRMEGFKPANSISLDDGLGFIKNAFPNASFPLGCLHEFLCTQNEDLAATSGFVAGLMSLMIGSNGAVLWIGKSRKLFPPALKCFGIEPDRFIFIDVQNEKHVLWAFDEALKCNALTAVVGELKEISFTESRRLQLAAEQSQVTGFILRKNLKAPTTTACVSRWKISSLMSDPVDGLPGVGYAKWKVDLLKVKNGRPVSWDIQWRNKKFVPIYKPDNTVVDHQRKKAG
jgi:protein ImuA